jgi:hypothetical protein
MKILKTEDIKTKIVEWLKTTYTDGYEIDGGHYYTTIRMKDIGGVDLHFLRRRHIRVKGVTSEQLVGGGVSFGRRDGSMLVHGGAKSDFGIFDEVELKRRIDYRFKSKIEQAEATKKSQQDWKDKCDVLDPLLVSYGYVPDSRYGWQKVWEYDRKVGLTLRQGSKLVIDLHSQNITEEQILKLAKVIKETLSGELTSNPV